MLVDLNIPWPVNNLKTKPLGQQISTLRSILVVLVELKYTHVALNLQLDPSLRLTKKDFSTIGVFMPIDLTPFKDFAGKLKIYTRVTITLNDPADFPGLKNFNDCFDILAIQPTNDKALSMCITNLEIDIITFNYHDNMRFWLRNKAVHSGIAKGRKFEIVYNPIFGDVQSRRNFVSAAKNLIRASRSIGILISSGALLANQVKTKFDIENLLKLLNVSHHQIPKIINETPLKVLLSGKLREVSYKQTVSVGVDVLESKTQESGTAVNNVASYKRKIDDDELSILNKLQRKRRS